jgi:hypothetical protein
MGDRGSPFRVFSSLKFWMHGWFCMIFTLYKSHHFKCNGIEDSFASGMVVPLLVVILGKIERFFLQNPSVLAEVSK